MMATHVLPDVPRDEQVLQLVGILRPICRTHPKLFLDASKIVLRLEAVYWEELRQANAKAEAQERQRDREALNAVRATVKS